MSDATPDPLIAPRIATLSAQLEAEKLTPADLARSFAGIWPLVPRGLRPFIESPTLGKLAEVLEAHPRLYWHPLVARQFFHLEQVVLEEGTDSPRGAKAVACIKTLVEAHAKGLHVGTVSGKPGPKPGFENPYPAMPHQAWISPATLERDFCALRELFKAKLKSAGGLLKGVKGEVKGRYRQLLLEVLKDSDIEWTTLAYRDPKSDGTPTGASGDFEARDAATWHDENFLEPWVSLDEGTADALAEKFMEWKKLPPKDGNPARMACATLAALLDATPAQVRDKIANQRRKKNTANSKPTA